MPKLQSVERWSCDDWTVHSKSLKNYTGYIFIELNLVFSNWKFWNFLKQKLKEEREAKRAQLDGRHDYILSIVASCLGLEKADVEDAILEGNQVLCT